MPIDGLETRADLQRFVETLPRSGSELQAQGRIVALEALLRSGTGSPESVVAAPVGTIYLRADGGTGTTFYVKETGSGATGWVGK